MTGNSSRVVEARRSGRDPRSPNPFEAAAWQKGRLTPKLVWEHFLLQRDAVQELSLLTDSGRFIWVRGQRFWLEAPARTGHFSAKRMPGWREYLSHPILTIRRCSTFDEVETWRFKRRRLMVTVDDGVTAERDVVIIQAAEVGPSLRGTGFALEMLKAVLRAGHAECFVQGEAPNENARRWHRHLNRAMPSRMLLFPAGGSTCPQRRVAPGAELDMGELW